MTPTQEWIMELALVYAVPSFLSGVCITLLCVRWRDVRQAMAIMPHFLSPKLTLERRALKAITKDESLLPDGLRLR